MKKNIGTFLQLLACIVLLNAFVFTSAFGFTKKALRENLGLDRSLRVVSERDQSITSNQIPVANAGNDWFAGTYIRITLDGTESYDPDENYPLTYSWTQTSGPVVSLDDPSSATPKLVTPLAPCVLVYSLVVTDSLGDSSLPDEIVVTVFNARPVADAGPDQFVATGSVVKLDATGSYDPNGDIPLSYSWTQTSGPVVLLSNPNAFRPSFTAPLLSSEIVFELIVTDSLSMDSLSDSVTITVQHHLFLPQVSK